jgi:LuxR family maltose regulon positive regulatory protein
VTVSRHVLFGRLEEAGRVIEVSGPAGSGKTTLLRSWLDAADLTCSAAWASVQGNDRDPRRFWISVAEALRGTAAGSALGRSLTAPPAVASYPDGWAITRRLLEDLGSLREQMRLVIDDLHQLRSADTLRQLKLFLTRTPPELRFVLVTRHDLRLGLHRLRLEGELTEIRAADLRFTVDEARSLLKALGVVLPEPTLALLVERTEGWAAGLSLAARSLAGHPDQERFVAEFSGCDRNVAEYLLAEVLEPEPEEVRRLLRRTSVLDRVTGPLADLLTGDSGGERTLQELEAANAFVTSVDAQRTWFRFHQLFADLLRSELRHAEPAELPALHRAAAGWYGRHGHPMAAVRHAQAAQEWTPAAPGDQDAGQQPGLGGELRALAMISLGIAELWSIRVEGTAHATPIAEVPHQRGRAGGSERDPGLPGPLSDSETRVLRYLPTNLSAPKIAVELSVSVNTVRTHIYHLYAKLGAHSRAEAVDQARAAGLLADSPHRSVNVTPSA